MNRRGTKRPRFSVGGQPVYENEDSSNHSALGITDYDDNSLSQTPEVSMNNFDQQNFPQNQFVPDRSKPIQQSSIKSSNDDNTNLNTCLNYLLRLLILKDKEGFFQYPVTDQLAPGYSQIITNPMDFSTMKKKINHDEYSNILEFCSDFELMCNNAMKYNRPETIYWQAAKRLLSTGNKSMTKDKLINLRRSVECFSHLTERELGFRLDSVNHINDEQIDTSTNNTTTTTTNNNNENLSNQSALQRKTKVALKLPRYYEKLPTLLADEEEDEELSPEEILSQAQQAAHCAREKLSLRRPISAYTLSCQRTNGTTSLRFINQDDLSQQQQQQSQTRTITIGELSNIASSAGGPSSNAYHPHSTPIVNESEKRNHLLPRYFLDYGPFSSHAPQYDSSFSSLSKDELDLLVHTYGSEFSAQYAVSLIDYVKDSGDLALTYVDRFLSVVTNGEHDNVHTKRQNKQGQENVSSNGTTHISSTDSVKMDTQVNSNGNIQHKLDMKLDENAKLLIQLRQAQYDRLCQPSNKIHQIINSSQQQQQSNEPLNEYDLAEKVLCNLSDMTHLSSNGPEQVISPETIRHNLGIVIHNESSPIDTL
ncbi:unnamed protein product [Adineta steineri]|uniref:Bromo domain-containing protein n=1 Tax=Adineta steineri TaxID=433720 RepID=A0A813P026_9BILA|nr:unnamed protein product [Adineta steineri]CAF3545234.1 unnamed protein product [Adineta steineri]